MFYDVTTKLGNMKKPQVFTLCPLSSPESRQVTIQSAKRIAQINLDTKKVVLSDGKGGHQGFMKLSPLLGSIELDCPAELIAQIEALPVQSGPIRVM